MEFWSSVRVILRRWYVVVGCLVVAGIIGAVVLASIKPSYVSNGALVFLEKNTATEAGALANTNPYRSLNAGTNGFANLMATVIDDPAFRANVLAAGGTDTYVVTAPMGQTSVLGLSVTDKSGETSIEAYKVLVRSLRAEMQTRQQIQGSNQDDLYTAADLTVPEIAVIQNAARMKVAIVIIAVGGLIALAMAFLVDAFANGAVARKFTDETDAPAELPEPPRNRAMPKPAHAANPSSQHTSR